MGGRGSKSGLSSAPASGPTLQRVAKAQPQPAPVVPPVQPVPPQAAPDPFNDTDTQGYHNLFGGRNYYAQQNLDIDTRTALQDWLDPNETPGSLYNFSQNVNWAMHTGQKLDAQQQFAYDSIEGSMHNLGYNLNLTRYDHGGFLDDRLAAAGVNVAHGQLSVAQIKSALVGQRYNDPRILSTSYNDFKGASDPTTFTTREVRVEYRAKASAQAIMPGTGPGGDFGEILLGPSGTKGHNGYHIVDVKASGAKARPKGGSKTYLPLQQITLVVEVD